MPRRNTIFAGPRLAYYSSALCGFTDLRYFQERFSAGRTWHIVTDRDQIKDKLFKVNNFDVNANNKARHLDPLLTLVSKPGFRVFSFNVQRAFLS
jgi:hypothetical protein